MVKCIISLFARQSISTQSAPVSSTHRQNNPLYLSTLFLILFISTSLTHAVTVPGYTPGELSISPGGAATYSVPIAVPPGVAGMQPSLSLNYSSQGGNGLLGMGWSLGGLSAISRCPATYEQDGFKGGIKFDSNDKLCLDGQRLIVISGNYGSSGSEYRTETDSFSKIIFHGTVGSVPGWFEVHTKSGQTIEYGNTKDSRIEAQGKPDALSWAVNKISDAVGNYLAVSYFEDNANGESFPIRIDYSGNSVAGTTANTSVQFQYEARPDESVGYISGSVTKRRNRMASVKTYSGSTLIQQYPLSYEVDSITGRSHIIGIAQCDAVGECMPTTTYSWQVGGLGLASDVVASDFSGSGWSSSAYPRYFADANGDGKTDVILVPNEEAIAYVFLATSEGSISHLPITSDLSGSGWNANAYSRHFFDVSGDGIVDLVLADKSEAIIFAFLGQGDGSFSGIPVTTDVAGNGWSSAVYERNFVDANGDGIADLVLFTLAEAATYTFFGPRRWFICRQCNKR